MTERRADYIELAEIRVLLGKVVERLDNAIIALNKHEIADDKVADRVAILEGKEKQLNGRIIGLSAACTVIGFVIGKLPIHW